VAATGLLGINPYQKGVAIDISSKPINLAIQLEQKEAAKKEALDKYLMDYEKSLNPAGMRTQDQDVFLGKLAQAKQYYLQNREKILNPAKYGADAQSNYFASLRDAQNAIGQSKQAMAQDKLSTQHFIAQKDLNAPDGYAEALQLSHLPISDPRYRPLDVTQWKFYKTYNPMEHANKVYSKIPLSQSAPDIIPIDKNYFYTKKTSKIDPQYQNTILQQGFIDYTTDEGLRKEMNHVFDTNKTEVKRLEEKYKTKIPNAQALSGYNLWDLQPYKETTTDIEPTEEYKSYLIGTRSKNKGGVVKMENLFDKTGAGGVPVKIGGSGYEIVSGKVLDKNGNSATVNFKNFSGENFQPELYSVLEKYGINLRRKDKYRVVAKDGRIESIIDSKGNVIDRKTIMNAQKKFDTERKGEEPLYEYGEEGAPKAKTYKGVDKNGNPIYE